MRAALKLVSLLVVVLSSTVAWANQRTTVLCYYPGTVTVSGISSTSYAPNVYPYCQVAVYLTGTQTLATIYSDNGSPPTPQLNPFAANNLGIGYFYVANGRYDVTISPCVSPSPCVGPAMPGPLTTGDMLIQDATGAGTISGQVSGKIPLATGPTAITAASSLDDGLTTPATITSSEPFNAPSVNGVLDLKVKFGASGSQQTMTCTATASSANLTSCTGGDFTVGSTVFIPTQGITSTTGPPTGITVTCESHNGGSCTGSTVYGYELATVQGYGNGAITAVSAPVTVTQATQTPESPQNAGRPDVGTHVTWTPATNTGSIVIYRSVNGGAYTFYSMLLGTTAFDDFGHMAAASFTCTDMGVPCTPPSAAVPNDVYAKVSAVSGGTYTLSALSPQPKYRAGQGLPTFYPSVPQVGGTVVVQHDDTPALTAAWNYLITTPQVGLTQLNAPCGNYNLHNEDQFGIENAFRLAFLHDFIFSGAGDCTKFFQSNDRSSLVGNFIVGQCGDGAGMNCGPRLGPNFGPNTTAYALSDPVQNQSLTVTLSTPSQASNFPAGTYVTIYNNSSNPYPSNTYGEFNLVTASNTTTGVVTLAYPTDKYYSATLVPPYSVVCPLCAGAPSMSISSGVLAKNITIRDFWYKGQNNFLNVNTIDGITIKGITGMSSFWSSTGYMRNMYVKDNKVTEDSFWNGVSGLAVGAAGDGDMTVSGNTYTSLHSSEFGQSCTEGTANAAWTNNVMKISGIADSVAAPGGGVFGAAAGCFNLTFSGNTMNISNTNMLDALIVYATSGQITGNNFQVDTVAQVTQASLAELLDSLIFGANGQAVSTSNNYWKIGNGGAGLKIGPLGVVQAPYEQAGVTGISGNWGFYPYYGSQTVLNVALTGNVNQIAMGSNRITGYYFAIAFTQPASGGPYFLPVDCNDPHWSIGAGTGIDCPFGPPTINPAPSSRTYLWFYDDGTNIHLISLPFKQPISPTTYSLGSQSGGVAIYPVYGLAGQYTMAMTGNITSVNIGSTRKTNYPFAIAFTQPASGGPYTAPPNCTSGSWGVAIDCPNGTPTFNPAASSTTYFQFFDDGTTVHLLGSNYTSAASIVGLFTGCSGTQYLGADGACHTVPTAPLKITNNITPAAATTGQCAEQTFTYSGFTSGQQVSVSPPNVVNAHVWIGWARIPAINVLSIGFCSDSTGGTPAAGNYIAVAQ